MTENQAREVIYAAVVAAWTPTPAVAMAFDDEVFKADGETEWARTTVHFTGNRQQTLGVAPNRKFRKNGIVVTNLNVALDTGSQRMDQLARLLVDGLDSKVVNDVWFLAHEYTQGGGDSSHFRGTVTIPFTYDEVR